VRERLNDLAFEYAFTPAYSPRFNGIEEVWSLAKAAIKADRLRCLTNGTSKQVEKMIEEAMNNLCP